MITNLVLWKIPVEEKAALSVEPSLAELIRLLSNRSDQHFHIIKNELLGWGRINCYTTLIYMYKYLSISVTTWLIVINECVYSRRKMPLTSCLCLEFHIGEHRNAHRGGGCLMQKGWVIVLQGVHSKIFSATRLTCCPLAQSPDSPQALCDLHSGGACARRC